MDMYYHLLSDSLIMISSIIIYIIIHDHPLSSIIANYPLSSIIIYGPLSRVTNITGWWFQTFFFPFHIWDVILPIDFHIFQDGSCTTNQITSLFRCFDLPVFQATVWVSPRTSIHSRSHTARAEIFDPDSDGKAFHPSNRRSIPIPYAPCMVYLPTFGCFFGQMLVNMPYMEHMGIVWMLTKSALKAVDIHGNYGNHKKQSDGDVWKPIGWRRRSNTNRVSQNTHLQILFWVIKSPLRIKR